MTENCKVCGLELFAAQRFCRSCGAPTEQLSEEQTPTRMMPPQPEGWGARNASTAPTSRPETAPVYDPPGGYQPGVPPMYPSVIPPYAPPRKRSPLGWILAFIGMGLFAVVVLAVMLIARRGRGSGDDSRQQSTRIVAPQEGEAELNEANADEQVFSGNTTTLTKTFPLNDGAKFSLKNVNGGIVIKVWDQPKAVVKVTKQGPDRGGQVFFASNNGNLSVRTPSVSGGNREVRYEVTLPRRMGRVTISSANGSIKLAGVTGQIFVESTNGAIELTNVVGVSKVQTVNGKIRAVLDQASDGPMEFTAQNGSIEVSLKSDFEADLEASTEHGGINIDDEFGISVQKEIARQSARGQIGGGGQLLKIKTTNGGIKLSKESGDEGDK